MNRAERRRQERYAAKAGLSLEEYQSQEHLYETLAKAEVEYDSLAQEVEAVVSSVAGDLGLTATFYHMRFDYDHNLPESLPWHERRARVYRCEVKPDDTYTYSTIGVDLVDGKNVQRVFQGVGGHMVEAACDLTVHQMVKPIDPKIGQAFIDNLSKQLIEHGWAKERAEENAVNP